MTDIFDPKLHPQVTSMTVNEIRRLEEKIEELEMTITMLETELAEEPRTTITVDRFWFTESSDWKDDDPPF